MASSDCLKFKGVVLIVLLHVGPLAGYIVDTGQCDCLPYSQPCIKEAVLISAASTFSNRVLACLPGMRLCCDAKTTQGGRSEQLGLSDQIRGFVLQMPNMLRRNRTRSLNSGLKGRSQRLAYNPLLDGIKVKNSQESELGITVSTTSADIWEDEKPRLLTGVEVSTNANAENMGTSFTNPDVGYNVNEGIGETVFTVTDSENLSTVLPMPSENKYESTHNSSDGFDLPEPLNSTHAEISVPVREVSLKNGLENSKQSSPVFSSGDYESALKNANLITTSLYSTQVGASDGEYLYESTRENGHLVTTSVYSTQVGASNGESSNSNTMVDTSSHNSETDDIHPLSTLNFNPLETDRISGKQKIEEAVETTLASLGQIGIREEASTVAVTSFDVNTSSWIPPRDGDMVTEVSSMPTEYLSPSVLLHNSYKPSSPTVEPVTAVTKEGDERTSPFIMSSINTSKSPYEEYPVTLISNVIYNSASEIASSKVSPDPFIPENLSKGNEAAPVVKISEDIRFTQTTSVSENLVPLVSDTFVKDNATAIIDSTSLQPNPQTVPLEASNESGVQDSAGSSEDEKSSVELLDTGMLSLATNLQNVNARNLTELEGSIQAVPVQNSNSFDLELPQTLLLSRPYPADERSLSGFGINTTLVEMVTEDGYKSNLDTSNYTDLVSQIGKTLDSKGILPSPTTTLLSGINTFVPGDYSKGSKSLPSEFRKFLLPNTELAITENNVRYTTTKTFYIILRPAATRSPGPTTVKKETSKLTSIPHGSQESEGSRVPMFVTPSSDSQEQFNDYLNSVREEYNKSNLGKNNGYFNWIFG